MLPRFLVVPKWIQRAFFGPCFDRNGPCWGHVGTKSTPQMDTSWAYLKLLARGSKNQFFTLCCHASWWSPNGFKGPSLDHVLTEMDHAGTTLGPNQPPKMDTLWAYLGSFEAPLEDKNAGNKSAPIVAFLSGPIWTILGPKFT